LTWEERPRTLRSAPEPTHRNNRSARTRTARADYVDDQREVPDRICYSVGVPIAELGGEPAQQRDRFGPGELGDPDRGGGAPPARIPGGDQHLPGAVGQVRGERVRVFGVVEDPQPPVPAQQRYA
jgi:hypothetical protein